MEGQDTLFEMTVGDSPLVRPARVGFLAGILAVWFTDGRPKPSEAERFKEIARSALERANEVRRSQ